MNQRDGGLFFDATLNNEQLIAAVDETVRRIQGISKSAEDSGKKMDAAFYKSAGEIRQALGMMGHACELHESQIVQLEAKYKELGDSLLSASKKGDDGAVSKLKGEMQAVEGQIVVRKKMLQEVQETSNELEKLAQKKEAERQETEQNTKAQQSLRSRIRELREEMALLIEQGIDEQSDAYKALANELGRLQDIQGDIAQQGKILANDEVAFQGVIQGISGVAGGLSAATGAVSLFAGENENLQKVMAKVQSVMAITIGLQQVAQTLNKDSSFMLHTVRKAKELLTVAEIKFAAALGISTVAAKALMATLTLGLSVAITATITLIDKIISKNNESKKAQEEFSNAIVEGCYKSVAKIEGLSAKYTALGNNIKEKEQFIKDNKKAFDELGVSITSVSDAENLLIKNKDVFIAAQIAKAKAMVYAQQATEKIKKLMELQAEHESMSDTRSQWVQTSSFGTGYFVQVENTAKEEKKKEIEALNKEIKEDYNNVIQEEANTIKAMQDSGIKATKEYAKGTVGAIEQAISEKQEALKDLVPKSAEWNKVNKEIEALQKQLEKPTKKTTSKSDKDPFVEQLEKRKQAYIEIQKLLESSDEKTRNEGERRWAELKKQGASYLEYLKNERDKLVELGTLSSKQQSHLSELYKRIAEADGNSLDLFRGSLGNELDQADSIVAKIEILNKARKNIKGDTEIDKGRLSVIDEEEKKILARTLNNYAEVQGEHRNFLNYKKTDYERYTEEVARLEKALSVELNETQKKILTTELESARIKRDDARANEYAAIVEEFRTFEEKCTEIANEYAQKRALVGDNESLKAQIDEEERRKKSSLAAEELQKSNAWSNLFSDLDSLTLKQIDTLIQEIEKKFESLSGVLNPIDLQAIRKQLNEAREVIIDKNPFSALSDALKSVLSKGRDENKKSVEQIKIDWKNLSQATSGAFDFVHNAVESCAPLKEIIGEVGATALSSLSAISSSAIAVATAVKTAEQSTVILAIIQAALVAVQVLVGLLQWYDKSRENSIKKHSENIKRLEREYANLERAIERTFGTEKYDNARKAIQVLQKTAEEARKKADEERKKNKPKQEKIEEYEREAEKVEQQREDFINKLQNEILGGSAKSIAEELGNAFVDAFARGEDALEAWGKSVDKMIQGIAKRMIVEKILGKQIDAVMQQYTEQWMGGNGKIDPDKVVGGANSFAEALNEVGAKNKDAIEAILKAMGISKDMGSETTLKGAIKGVTEKTAGLIEGQMNAIRINQLKATDLLREQIQKLSAIEYNTKYLISIDKRLSNMQGNNNRDRAFGL